MFIRFQPLNILVFVVVLCFVSQSVEAIIPMKFGQPDRKDLEMKVYELDSSAKAVILCNYGYFNSKQFEFTQIMRIKILKKSGTVWGNREFTSMASGVIVSGKTFNLEDGQVVESKLRRESIFEKPLLGNYFNTSIAMPNVKVGSVIDIQVTTKGIPQIWRFQELIPVKYSELIMESSQYIDYQQTFFGYLPFDQATTGHWVMKNVPAFKIEPHMDSYKNYISKVEFDIRSFSFPGFYKNFTTTWNEVGKTLTESNHFGGVIDSGDRYLKEQEEEIRTSYNSIFDRIKAAFEKIKMIKWNGVCSEFTSTNALGLVFRNKIGNSADINLLLVKLLNRLDIKAYPVVLSTRENGQLSPIFPSLNKLNYTVCYVAVGDEKIVLDATEEKLPEGMLPERALNNSGRVIYSKEKTEEISLVTDKKDIKKVFQQLKLNPDLTITGERVVSYQDYGAFEKRKDLAGFNSQSDYLKDCESKFSGLIINNCEISNRDSIYKKLTENWSFRINRHVQDMGDILMLNLNVFEQLHENPFKLEKRVYPVHYPYCSTQSNTVILKIPKGYEVSEIPSSTRVLLPNNAGSFLINYRTQNNTIVMNCKICIDKLVFLPEEYPLLREFFTQIVKKQAEPVILKRI